MNFQWFKISTLQCYNGTHNVTHKMWKKNVRKPSFFERPERAKAGLERKLLGFDQRVTPTKRLTEEAPKKNLDGGLFH